MKIWLKRFLSAAFNANASSQLPPSVGRPSLLTSGRVEGRLAKLRGFSLSRLALGPPAVKSVRSRKEARRGEGKRAGSIKHIWVRRDRLTARLSLR